MARITLHIPYDERPDQRFLEGVGSLELQRAGDPCPRAVTIFDVFLELAVDEYPVVIEGIDELRLETVAWYVEQLLTEDANGCTTRLGEPTVAKLLGRLGPQAIDRIYVTDSARNPDLSAVDSVFRLFRPAIVTPSRRRLDRSEHRIDELEATLADRGAGTPPGDEPDGAAPSVAAEPPSGTRESEEAPDAP